MPPFAFVFASLAATTAGEPPLSLAEMPQPGGPAVVGSAGSEPIAIDRDHLHRDLANDTRQAIDAGIADLILSGLGLASAAPAPPTPSPDVRWRLGPRSTTRQTVTGLTGQTTQAFGSADGLALLWRHEINRDATLSNEVRLRHASGPIDTQLSLVGQLSLLEGRPLALSFRSSTTIAVLPFVSLGADAQGPLGSRAAIRPGLADSLIEPHLKFTLPLLGATAGASTGWRVPTGAAANADPAKHSEFRWNVTFRKAL